MIPMRNLSRAALLGLALLAAGQVRAEGTPDPAAVETLTARLVAEGYDVRKVDSEDGMIEVYAVRDGQTFEMYFDAELALVKSCTDGACTDASGAPVSAEGNQESSDDNGSDDGAESDDDSDDDSKGDDDGKDDDNKDDDGDDD